MAESDKICKFCQVYADEIKEEILPRRKAAGVEAQVPDPAAHARESLVGVALSGGGSRAAAFGLGVLQVLYRHKLMRHVDYLSTVSGGGYCGSLFSSLVNHPQGNVVWKDSQIALSERPATETAPTPAESSFTFESGEGGKQPPLVRALSTSGPVLRRPVWFACAYFFGLLLTNLVALSGLLAAGALFAYLFQALNEPRVATFIGALGFNDDFKVAFFPAFVLTLLWVLCMVVGSMVEPLEFLMRGARGLFVMLVASLAMAVVALIGSGNIDISGIGSTVGVSNNSSLVTNSSTGRFWSVILLVIALAPYLQVKELVRSGVRPKGFKDRWIFAIASRALLYGVPLLIFGYFVGENYSRFNEERLVRVNDLTFSKSDTFYPSYFGKNWPTFWQTVETSAKSRANASELKPDAFTLPLGQIDRALWQNANGYWAIWKMVETSTKELKAANAASDPDKFALLRGQVDRTLWQIANANGSGVADGIPYDNAILFGRMRQSSFWLPTAATTDKGVNWSWPTNDDDHREAAAKVPHHDKTAHQDLTNQSVQPKAEASPAERVTPVSLQEPSIIDLEQDLQASLDEYNKQRYMVEKWLLLPSLFWPKHNSLANYNHQRIKERARDFAICDRLNLQFLSNPFVAAAFLNELNQNKSLSFLPGDKDNPNYKRSAQAQDLIVKLDRNPAGAVARKLATLTDSEWRDLDRTDPPLREDEDSFVREFLEWQPLKHRLLYLERLGRSDEQLDDSKEKLALASQIKERLEGEKAASHLQRDFEAVEAGLREFNLACLDQLFYPNQFQPQSTVFSSVVLPEDQKARWKFFVWAICTCLISSVLVNLNFSSIHSYYQQLMAKVWIVDRPGNENRLPLVQLNNTSVGAPYHLMHGAVSLAPRGRFKPDFPRGGFLFSKRYCGGVDRGYLATSELRNVDLATAMSVSGAAITPSAVENQLVWAIMFVCNLRTGQWLAWPSAVTTRLTDALYRFAQWLPGMSWHVALNACLPPAWRTMTFVYDGGLYENLGVEPLLARRCRLIIAVDAAEDGDSQFADFQLLVQRCRSRYGVMIEEIKPDDQNEDLDVWMSRVSPKWVKSSSDPQKRTFADRLAEQGVMLFRIKYPSYSGLDLPPLSDDKREGTLVYIKPTLTKSAFPDVLGYAQSEGEFPQDATLNQFYEPRQFDAYRSLGVSLGEDALKELQDHAGKLPGVELYWKPPSNPQPVAAEPSQPEERPAEAERGDFGEAPKQNPGARRPKVRVRPR